MSLLAISLSSIKNKAGSKGLPLSRNNLDFFQLKLFEPGQSRRNRWIPRYRCCERCWSDRSEIGAEKPSHRRQDTRLENPETKLKEDFMSKAQHLKRLLFCIKEMEGNYVNWKISIPISFIEERINMRFLKRIVTIISRRFST